MYCHPPQIQRHVSASPQIQWSHPFKFSNTYRHPLKFNDMYRDPRKFSNMSRHPPKFNEIPPNSMKSLQIQRFYPLRFSDMYRHPPKFNAILNHWIIELIQPIVSKSKIQFNDSISEIPSNSMKSPQIQWHVPASPQIQWHVSASPQIQ
jgi:hypothetical protein